MLALLLALACAPETVGPGARDLDGDGFVLTDCAPGDRAVSPDAPEVCNGVDDDCDGAVDDADPSLDVGTRTSWYVDGDADGYGAEAVLACVAPAGAIAAGGDCDDADAEVSPGALETCDGADDDCDGEVDERCDGPAWIGVAEADAALYCSWEYARSGLHAARAADLDADGAADLVVWCEAEDRADGDLPKRLWAVRGPHAGEVVADRAGGFVTSAHAGTTGEHGGFDVGDVTGDGLDDLVLGSPDEAAVLVFAGPLAGEGVSMGAAARAVGRGSDAHTLDGGVRRVGDLDGDGLAEVLASAAGSLDSTGTYRVGRVSVLPGGFSGAIETNTLPAVKGAAEARIGALLADAGDVDGDGLGDVLLGPTGGTGAWLFLGPLEGERALADADAAFAHPDGIEGVAGVGDLDGDGLAEVAFGSRQVQDDRGAVYVVSRPGPGVADLPAAAIATLWGGEGEAWHVGAALDGAGDVDGDGHADLVVGAPRFTNGAGWDVGAAFVCPGPLAGGATLVDAAAWVVVSGASMDQAGIAVAGVGDLDGDGLDDLTVSASNFSFRDQETGALFVIHGRAR